MSARYAIYYAPPADTALWRKASAWLGRDAYLGRDVARPHTPELADLDLAALTADPRGYGFHATLKSPFELVADRTEKQLLALAERFAHTQAPFELPIAVASLGRFLAFRIEGSTKEIDALHGACMHAFEPFRAALAPADVERRRKAQLSAEQDARLVQWGYPYVFEDFRFHMTLTSSIADDGVRERMLAALRDHFAAEAGPHRFDGIAVFKQADRKAPFDILQRFDFEARALAGA
jgi:putative phosphonate metabolism protein